MNAAEESKGRTWLSRNASCRLCRVGLDEAGIRVRQVEAKHVQLHPHAADHPNALTKVHLRMTRRMTGAASKVWRLRVLASRTWSLTTV